MSKIQCNIFIRHFSSSLPPISLIHFHDSCIWINVYYSVVNVYFCTGKFIAALPHYNQFHLIKLDFIGARWQERERWRLEMETYCYIKYIDGNVMNRSVTIPVVIKSHRVVWNLTLDLLLMDVHITSHLRDNSLILYVDTRQDWT